MTFKNQWSLIWHSGIFKYLWVGIIYGGLSGGIATGLNAGFNNEVVIIAVLNGGISSALVYMFIFSCVLGLIYVVQIQKVYLCFGMDRRDLVKNWTLTYFVHFILYILFELIMYFVITKLVDVVANKNERLMNRVFDVDPNHLVGMDLFKVFVAILLVMSFTYLYFSLLGVIANNYGWKYLVAFILITLALIVNFAPEIYTVFIWGVPFLSFLSVGLIMNVMLIVIIRKELPKMEVAK